MSCCESFVWTFQRVARDVPGSSLCEIGVLVGVLFVQWKDFLEFQIDPCNPVVVLENIRVSIGP